MAIAKKLKYHWDIAKQVNWIKTIYFNLHYLPLSQAMKLPIYVYRRTKINKAKGSIILNAPLYRGMVKIGTIELDSIDNKNNRTVWDVDGKVVFNYKATFGRGTSISVAKDATLNIGDGFVCMGKSSIICRKEIKFGGGSLLSWDILIMDTDHHKVLNKKGEVINPPSTISIGDDVWIGCRTTILKGAKIPSHSVVAANSLITRVFTQENTIIGGSGNTQRRLKSDITWQR